MFIINRFKRLCRVVHNAHKVYWNQFSTIGSIRNIEISSSVYRISRTRSIHLCSVQTLRNKPWKLAPCGLSNVLTRHKSNSKNRNKNVNEDEDEDDSDQEDDFDPELYSDFHDYDAPLDFKTKELQSLRANQVISKGLNLSSSVVDNHFYASKLLLNGKTLLKKSRKLQEGDKLDYIVEKNGNRLLVQRVNVVEISYRDTAQNQPIVSVRVWKKPFEVDSTFKH